MGKLTINGPFLAMSNCQRISFDFLHAYHAFRHGNVAHSSSRGDFELLCNGAKLRLHGAAQWQLHQRQHPLARNDRTIFSETTTLGSGEDIQLDRPVIWRLKFFMETEICRNFRKLRHNVDLDLVNSKYWYHIFGILGIYEEYQ